MAKMGDGYGSECHLLRWMGRHRRIFDQRVSAALGRPDDLVTWLDFDFDPAKQWPDAELKGLEFLYHVPGLKESWKIFWPTGRGIHNWDAVGSIGTEPERDVILIEAKAHVGELKSDCKASNQDSINKIREAFSATREALGVPSAANWLEGYYQYANRLATLYFLRTQAISARLLFVYFLGDKVPGKECPRSESEWQTAIRAQYDRLGLTNPHSLSDRVHTLFLPITEPLTTASGKYYA